MSGNRRLIAFVVAAPCLHIRKSCAPSAGHPSLPFSELHQRGHRHGLPCAHGPCWDASEGESQEGEPAKLPDRKLPELAQPPGRDSSKKQCSGEKQLPDANRYSLPFDNHRVTSMGQVQKQNRLTVIY